jgi:putative hydrolase of the HAD superfamily
MVKNSIRWVIFDLGGVVINVNFKNFFTALPAHYHARVVQQEQTLTTMFREYESRSGEELPEQVFDRIRDLIKAPITNIELIAAINAMLGTPIEEVCNVIETLSKDYSIACLSNTNHIHWEYLLKHYPIMKKFQVQIASHLVGASKPDARIYHISQKLLKADAQELLFFDDKSENIDQACSMGWNAFVCPGYQSILSACSSLNIII